MQYVKISSLECNVSHTSVVYNEKYIYASRQSIIWIFISRFLSDWPKRANPINSVWHCQCCLWRPFCLALMNSMIEVVPFKGYNSFYFYKKNLKYKSWRMSYCLFRNGGFFHDSRDIRYGNRWQLPAQMPTNYFF